MGASAQIVTRIDPALKSRIVAIAATANETEGELIRRCIEARLADEEATARANAAKRRNVPAAVTETAVELAMNEQFKAVNRNMPLTLPAHDLLSPASLALYRVLGAIWESDDIAAETREKIAKKLAVSLPQYAAETPEPVPSRPLRSRSRS